MQGLSGIPPIKGMVSERRVPLASENDTKSAYLCSLVVFSVGSYTDFETQMIKLSIDTSSVYRRFEIAAVRL